MALGCTSTSGICVYVYHQPYKVQDEPISPSATNDLSNPATTLSHNGQLLDSSSSSSTLMLSNFLWLVVFSSLVDRLPPPIPGNQLGDETKVARASGIIKSRSRSPAEMTLRPKMFAAFAPFCRGLTIGPKLADNRVRCVTGWRPFGGCVNTRDGLLTFPLVLGLSFISSFCRVTIRRKAWGGKYSFA